MAEVLLPTEIISKSNTMLDENETDSVKPGKTSPVSVTNGYPFFKNKILSELLTIKFIKISSFFIVILHNPSFPGRVGFISDTGRSGTKI